MLTVTIVLRSLKREANKLSVALSSNIASHRNLCVFHSHIVRRCVRMSNFEALSFITDHGCPNGHRSQHNYSVDADVLRGKARTCDSYEVSWKFVGLLLTSWLFLCLQKAIVALNSLQTNASVVKESISRPHSFAGLNLLKTEKYLLRSGISLQDLDKLSVIHVSGTKGKVSVLSVLLIAYEYQISFTQEKTGFKFDDHHEFFFLNRWSSETYLLKPNEFCLRVVFKIFFIWV